MEFSVLDDGCYCEQGKSFVFFIHITELHKTATSSIGISDSETIQNLTLNW